MLKYNNHQQYFSNSHQNKQKGLDVGVFHSEWLLSDCLDNEILNSDVFEQDLITSKIK